MNMRDIHPQTRRPLSTGRGNVGGREPTCLSAFQVPPFRPVKDVVAHKKKVHGALSLCWQGGRCQERGRAGRSAEECFDAFRGPGYVLPICFWLSFDADSPKLYSKSICYLLTIGRRHATGN